jgi:probable phosphoglycerate mutase
MTNWPSRLYLVRHGESAGNVALEAALASGAKKIDIVERDSDVSLSRTGEAQAIALGNWLGGLPAKARPETVLTSPYLRASQTASLIAANAGVTKVTSDERLREKEFGILDRLTKNGIIDRFPEQADLRSRLGKFYYRPPQGESWCDVVFRLRSALDTICLHHAGKNVLIVSHQVVVLCFRYLLEELDEKRILSIDAQGEIANCSITEYGLVQDPHDAHMELTRYNFVAPLIAADAPITAEPIKSNN